MVLPRGIGPGLRPSRIDSAFSVIAICLRTFGISAAAVSYRDWAWATFISETWPYLNLTLHEIQRLRVGLERALRDLELLVQPAQLDVSRGDLRDQGQDHAAPRLVGGEQIGLRRLGLTADAAPQVDLPGGAGGYAEGVRGVADAARQGVVEPSENRSRPALPW